MAERDWFATAFVRVKPDSTGFRKELRTQVQKSVSTAGVFKVPVGFDLKAFKRQLQNEARQAKVRVPVEPDVTKFRKQLIARLRTATKGVTVRVPVEVAAARRPAGGTGAPGGAGGGIRGQTEEERELARQQKLRQSVQDRLTASQAKYTAATSASLSATDKQNRLSRLSTSLAVADDKVTSELALARQRSQTALVAGLTPLQTEIAALRVEVDQKLKAAAAEARTGPLKEATNKATARSTELLAIEVATMTDRAALAELNNKLLNLEKVARANTASAQKLNATALAEENAAIGVNSALRRKAISDRLKEIGVERTHGTQLRNLSRGAGATGLSFLGLRGATLAAGSEFLVGAAAIAVFAKSLKAATELETELNVFAATTHATGDEMERIRELSLELGRDITLPGVAAQDAATAMTELAKAGLNVEESMEGARGVLQLATAAQIENADAAVLAANALNAFGLGGESAVRVADLLANSANLSQGSIEDMGIALRQSAAAARQAGITLTDTVAILTILARNGLRGSDAGTALRTALIRLVNPSKKAAAEIEKLNIRIRDSAGNVRPEVFSDIARATEDLTRAEQDRITAVIFGQDAFRTQSILGREGITVFNEMSVAVDRAGAAQELASARTKGFQGQVEALRNNLATLGTTFGSAIIGPLGAFISEVNKSVSAVNDMADAVEDLSGLLQGVFEIDTGIGFLDKEIKDGTNLIKEFFSVTAGGPIISTVKIGKFGADQFGLLTEQIDTASEASKRLNEILKDLQTAGGGLTAQNLAVQALQELVAELEAGSPASQRLARDVQKVIDQIQKFSGVRIDLAPERAPFLALEDQIRKFGGQPIQLGDIVLPENLGGTGEKIGGGVKSGLESFMAGDPFFSIGQKIIADIVAAAKPEAEKGGAEVGRVFATSLITQISIAEAKGVGDVGIEALLRKQLARREAFLARLEGRQDEPRTPKQQAKFDDLLRQAAENVSETTAQIEAIVDERGRKADEAKDNITKAREEADRKLIDALEAAESKVENRLIVAGGTERLQDDIRFTREMIALYNRQIQQARKQLKDAETRNKVIADITRKRLQAEQDLAKLKQDQAEKIREAREERLAIRRESLSLDIEIAESEENLPKEIKARSAEIRFLAAQVRAAKAGSIERKRLLAELRRAQKELRDLKKEKDKVDDGWQKLTFAFLQKETGFVENLIGNLIPGGLTTSLVGVGDTRPPRPGAGGDITRAGGAAPSGLGGFGGAVAGSLVRARQRRPEDVATRVGHVTAGQGNTQIDLLRKIWVELRKQNRTTDHPEAKQQRKTGSAAGDYGGGHANLGM